MNAENMQLICSLTLESQYGLPYYLQQFDEVGMVLPGDDVEDASVEGVVSPSTVLGAVDSFDIDVPDVPCVIVVSVAVIVVDVPNVVALAGANVDVELFISAAVVLFTISMSVF